MADIFVKEELGYKITVSPYSGNFTAVKGSVKLDADSLDALIEKMKEHDREQRRFKPLEVIHVDDDIVGRITSRTAEDDNEVYFSVKEEGEKRPTRRTESIEQHHWGSSVKEPSWNFVKATPENLAILEQIKTKDKQIKAIDDEQAALRKSYKDLVTHEVIEKQAGEKQA